MPFVSSEPCAFRDRVQSPLRLVSGKRTVGRGSKIRIMTRLARRRFVLAAAVTLSGAALVHARRPADFPSHLTDQEFWGLTEMASEPNGEFQSDNFLSNER